MRKLKLDFWKFSKNMELSEKKGRPNIRQELVNITSQLQMMSDALAACQTSTKHPSPRKERNTSCKWKNSTVEGKNNYVNYMINEMRDFLHLEKSKTLVSREEVLTRCYSDESLCSERFAGYASGPTEFPAKNRRVGMYNYREMDSVRMVELLERELKTLGELAPSVLLIISTLTDNLSHCRECRRCREKVSPSLPWILKRIQKLIKYVTTRRREVYTWPNDLSYLRLYFSKSSLQRAVASSSSSSVDSIPVTCPRLLGKLEKVDPVAVSEDNPGVQILLEVKPQLQKKKFFYPARQEDRSGRTHDASFPVVHLKEHASALVVQVLRPEPKPRINWEKKRGVTFLKEQGISFRVVHLRSPRIPATVTVAAPEARLITRDIKPVAFASEEVRSPAKNLLSISIERSEWDIGRPPYSICREKSNDKKTFLEKFRTSSPEVVRDFLTEAEEEEMQVQRVNELEEEVKELKDLMLEVHKNQTELGKLLLEKKVFSHLMVKLTDPKMLDEENKALKKASKMNAPSNISSTVSLQMKVDSLKRKCVLKNRLIMTLLRGLRSNVPKELWEEVIAYAFDDSESEDEFHSEKINEFIRQTSLFLTNEEKERKVTPSPSRIERLSSEEEPKVKGIVGAQVEDNLKNLSCYENQASADSKGVSAKIWAFPIMNVQDYTEAAVKKLENQISILNTENERLWHQVNELRELLKNSVKEMNLFESEQKITSIRTSGKTINVVIQIAEKDGRRSRDGGLFPEGSEVETSKSSPIVRIDQSESVTAIHEAERENSPTALFATGQDYARRLKSDRRRSENDLNYVDEASVHDYKQEKLRAVFRDRTYPNNRVQGLAVRTPHPSAHEMFQSFKPVVWVPSKYVIPEVCDAYGAGPSRQHGEMKTLLQKPSLMELAEMHPSVSNERELQTIPENDPDPSTTSRNVNQAIHRLRTRVRSLHKDMTVLRSKNDRIDKLLDRLMDDVVENNHNYEELESSLSSLKSRLG